MYDFSPYYSRIHPTDLKRLDREKYVKDPFAALEYPSQVRQGKATDRELKQEKARNPKKPPPAEVENLQKVATAMDLPLILKERINSGGFGDIYTGMYAGKHVIIKVESTKKTQYLPREYEIYIHLNHISDNHTYYLGIPRCYFFGSSRKMHTDFNLIVVHRMGPNLEQLWNQCKRNFSLHTTCLIALQCLDHLEYIHKNGIVHRDIKPANFVTAYTRDIFSRSCIYIIDFGLAEAYIKDGEVLPELPRVSRTGTASYMSKFTMQLQSPSPRDDLQSLGYMLVLLFKGYLPWTGITAATKEARKDAIGKMKADTPHSVLCANLPPCFYWLLAYSDCLKYGEFPNYSYLKGLFRSYFWDQNEWINYTRMDWNNLPKEEQEPGKK